MKNNSKPLPMKTLIKINNNYIIIDDSKPLTDCFYDETADVVLDIAFIESVPKGNKIYAIIFSFFPLKQIPTFILLDNWSEIWGEIQTPKSLPLKESLKMAFFAGIKVTEDGFNGGWANDTQDPNVELIFNKNAEKFLDSYFESIKPKTKWEIEMENNKIILL